MEMAADFALTFAAEGILKKVSSLARQEILLAWGFKDDLKKLEKSLNILQDFLVSAEDQRPQEQCKAVVDWVQRLKDVAQDADNALDEFNYELIRRKVELRNHIKRKVLNFFTASNPLSFRVKMAHRIKNINESLMELKKEASFINLVAKKRDLGYGGERAVRQQSDSFFERDEEVVGREDIIRDIVETVVSSDNEQNNLSVLAIQGLPGLGKTTLAKSVYNESEVSKVFQKKIWVCVSNTFELDTILSLMVDSLVPHKAGMKSQDAFIKVLREELAEKRYILVLDDVWNEDNRKWESLMTCLSKLGSNKGSVIIITTRSAQVSSMTETLTRPKLTILSDEECWSILKRRALNEGYCLEAERETIGRAIAKKCGGVPLVAKVLGSLMRSKASDGEWLLIKESEIWDLPEEEDRIMSVLKLSFDNLRSPSLKQCFAYCSILKKDFNIERDELVQLWMAQGLLQQPPTAETHLEMEDIGNEYFNILVQNSLLQEFKTYHYWGGNEIISTCTMHDLVHDLAEQVSRCNILTRDFKDTSGVQHVANVSASTLENISKETTRRWLSLFCHDKNEKNKVTEINFCKFKSLRALGLSQTETAELPSSIGKLKHLRYLDVSCTSIKALPKSISKLYNLQTLRVQYNYRLYKIPISQGLPCLRELKIVGCRRLSSIGQLGHCTSLQVLKITYCESLVSIPISQGLPCLRELKIKECKRLSSIGQLDHCTSLQVLDISSCESLVSIPISQGLPCLHELKIQNCNGLSSIGQLDHCTSLQVLDISYCESLVSIPISQGLPCLRELRIYGLNGLSSIGQIDHCTSLQVLDISSCESLVSIPISQGLPCLHELKIRKCNGLSSIGQLDHCTSLQVLDISYCESLISIPISQGLPCLRELRIYGLNGSSSIGQLDHCTSLQVLDISSCESLVSIPISQGLPCLHELRIRNCNGLSSIDQLDHCTSLQVLDISYCESLVSIPISQGLPCLRELRIYGLNGLSSIGQLDHCTSLQVLDISSCESLVSIPISQGLPCLRELKIRNCNGLSSIGQLDHCTSLQVLDISDCESLVSIPISQGLPCLRVLKIDGCEGLSSIGQLDHCTSLQVLEILDCESLVSIPIPQGLPCHRELNIVGCKGLSSIGQLDHCNLTRLEDLLLGPFWEELDSYPEFQVPPQLVRLKLVGWKKLKSLPQHVQQFTLLTKLTIESFDGVETLPDWLGNLGSLMHLDISLCVNLKYLPSLKAMRRLTKLQILEIAGCPLLEERCKRDGGEEWPKISHIPLFRIYPDSLLQGQLPVATQLSIIVDVVGEVKGTKTGLGRCMQREPLPRGGARSYAETTEMKEEVRMAKEEAAAATAMVEELKDRMLKMEALILKLTGNGSNSVNNVASNGDSLA